MISLSNISEQLSSNSISTDGHLLNSRDSLVQGIEVAFAIMPYHKLSTPALGASILQQCLTNHNISSRIFYYGFSFAKQIGLPLYNRITKSSPTHLIGEWTFSAAAFDVDTLNKPESYHFFKPEYESVYRCTPKWIYQCAKAIFIQ